MPNPFHFVMGILSSSSSVVVHVLPLHLPRSLAKKAKRHRQTQSHLFTHRTNVRRRAANATQISSNAFRELGGEKTSWRKEGDGPKGVLMWKTHFDFAGEPRIIVYRSLRILCTYKGTTSCQDSAGAAEGHNTSVKRLHSCHQAADAARDVDAVGAAGVASTGAARRCAAERRRGNERRKHAPTNGNRSRVRVRSWGSFPYNRRSARSANTHPLRQSTPARQALRLVLFGGPT